MSDTNYPAVEDEIIRDTKRALGQVMTAARTWIRQHRGKAGAQGVPRLSRRERRELAEAIRVQVGEQRIAAAWYTKRATDFHAEVVAAHQRAQRPGYSAQDRAVDAARLDGIRYSIESTLHETASLPLERRGQVVQALDAMQREPGRPYGAVFKTLDADRARAARAAAVASELGVADRRRDSERQAAVARRQERARRMAEPPREWSEMTRAQRDAVQGLRDAELLWQRGAGYDDEARLVELDARMRAAAQAVRDSGLPPSQVAHEREHVEANSQYQVRLSASDGRPVRYGYYPDQGTALAETEAMAARVQAPADTIVQVTTESRPDSTTGRAEGQRPWYRTAYGQVGDVQAATARWRDYHDERGTVPRGEGVAVGVEGVDPKTGQPPRSAIKVYSEAGVVHDKATAVDEAERMVMATERTWTERQQPEIVIDPGTAADWYTVQGSPSRVVSELGRERAAMDTAQQARTQQRETRTAGTGDRGEGRGDAVDELRAQIDQLMQRQQQLEQDYTEVSRRLTLSIEHNSALTTANGELTRRLTAMTGERDQAVTDAQTARGERDEAVRTLAERTPAAERLGSPERQARAVRESVNAFAPETESVNAFSPEAERNGFER